MVFCQFPPCTVSRTAGAQREPQDLRRTYRRTSFQLARLMTNMGVAAPTPLLARFSSPVTATDQEKRWLDTFYLDQPEEWDDPYRSFRWWRHSLLLPHDRIAIRFVHRAHPFDTIGLLLLIDGRCHRGLLPVLLHAFLENVRDLLVVEVLFVT